MWIVYEYEKFINFYALNGALSSSEPDYFKNKF
jgi:hypothetical protein